MRKKNFLAFLKDRRGSIATIGGLTFGVAIATVALSVTVARTYEVRADLQRGLDAALLSAARSPDFIQPQAMVKTYLESYVKNTGVPAKEMDIVARFDEAKGVLVAQVKFRVDSVLPFPKIVSEQMRPRVDSQVTPRGMRRLEIAFALDMSGSMNAKLSDGRTRIEGLKEALNDLFNMISAEQKSEEESDKSKVLVSIVPYASSVNIGNVYGAIGSSSLYSNTVASTAGPEPHAFFAAPKASRASYMADYYGLGVLKGVDANGTEIWDKDSHATINAVSTGVDSTTSSGAKVPHLLRGIWAMERTGVTDRDVTPTGSKIAFGTYQDMTRIMRERLKRDRPSGDYSKSFSRTWATPVMHVIPLTDDIVNLRKYANNMVAYGGTAGHVGMEWALYSLSPNWGGVWAYQPTSTTGVFKKVTKILPDVALARLLDNLLDGVGQVAGGVLDIVGGLLGGGSSSGSAADYVNPVMLPAPYEAGNTTKVIVMMTDGLFNAPLNTGKVGTTVADTYAHFEAVCAAAKAKGITVYTIAFSDDAQGRDSLRKCASTNRNFTAVDDTAQLSQTFRRIFVASSSLYVSQ